MKLAAATEQDYKFIREAYNEAAQGFDQGGVPVGAVMVKDGEVVARGRNKRVQEGDAIMHGETDCLRSAGVRADYKQIHLYTTLSPCMMCTGAIVHFDIPRVIIGEDENFPGNIEFLTDRGVDVVLLEDQECIDLMARFIKERPDIWFEDIAGNKEV